MDIVVIGDDIPKIDANAQIDPLCVREISVSLNHRLLQCDGADNCLHGARELDQNAVALDPDNSTSTRADLGPNHFAQYSSQTPPCADLVLASQAAVTDHIGKHNCL
jgi:hypothetical protein